MIGLLRYQSHKTERKEVKELWHLGRDISTTLSMIGAKKHCEAKSFWSSMPPEKDFLLYASQGR